MSVNYFIMAERDYRKYCLKKEFLKTVESDLAGCLVSRVPVELYALEDMTEDLKAAAHAMYVVLATQIDENKDIPLCSVSGRNLHVQYLDFTPIKGQCLVALDEYGNTYNLDEIGNKLMEQIEPAQRKKVIAIVRNLRAWETDEENRLFER